MSMPNYSSQAAQRASQQASQAAQRASQNAQRAHQMAVDAARRGAQRPMSPSMRWSGGPTVRRPFSFVGFVFKVALLVAIVALAITFGPQLIDEVQQQVDNGTGTGTGTGTETPVPEGP